MKSLMLTVLQTKLKLGNILGPYFGDDILWPYSRAILRVIF